MEQRRAEIEEERRLAIEQKEDEKILRMEKNVRGVMLETDLKDEEDEEENRSEIHVHDENEPPAKNIFIPTLVKPVLLLIFLTFITDTKPPAI